MAGRSQEAPFQQSGGRVSHSWLPARSQGSGLDVAESGRAARVPYPVDGFHFCG